MITKGIIESVINPFQVRVRIPLLNGIEGSSSSTPSKDLPIATINCLPGVSPLLQAGDIVFVGFDSNDESKPIMLGFLSIAALHGTAQQLSAEVLQIQDRAILPENTTIGTLTQSNLFALIRAEGNFEDRIEALERAVKNIQSQLPLREEGNT